MTDQAENNSLIPEAITQEWQPQEKAARVEWAIQRLRANQEWGEETDLEKELGPEILEMASQLHENWRHTRFNSDKNIFEPRIKNTTDSEWISKNNTSDVDIANTSFKDLPKDWQKENLASAQAAITFLVKKFKDQGNKEVSSELLEKTSEYVHDKWLERNGSWASEEQKLPYGQLSETEKEKDRDFVRAAIKILTTD